MKKIITRDFGEIEFNENEILLFPNGLYAFEEEHEFVLISEEALENIYWLQSVNTPNLCFIVFDSSAIVADYSPIFEEDCLKIIDAEKNDLKYLLISVIKEDYTKSTVNLKSPIAVNEKNKKCMQIICNNDDYEVKHPIMSENS